MNHQEKVTGVILAGGLARRMQNRDKGLVYYNGQPLISYAISAMLPIVDVLLINANRSLDDYQQFGFPVITDQTDQYEGPLAGILAAMHYAKTEVLMVMPCDSPLFKTQHLNRLLHVLADADVALAFDGERLHPVFLAIKTKLSVNLQAYLASDQRKITAWLDQQDTKIVDFREEPEIFSNINSLDELALLESQTMRKRS
jgi:molybdenum cofactor guanylyltransferase